MVPSMHGRRVVVPYISRRGTKRERARKAHSIFKKVNIMVL